MFPTRDVWSCWYEACTQCRESCLELLFFNNSITDHRPEQLSNKHRKNCETALTPGIPGIPGLWNLAEIVKFGQPPLFWSGTMNQCSDSELLIIEYVQIVENCKRRRSKKTNINKKMEEKNPWCCRRKISYWPCSFHSVCDIQQRELWTHMYDLRK